MQARACSQLKSTIEKVEEMFKKVSAHKKDLQEWEPADEQHGVTLGAFLLHFHVGLYVFHIL